MPFSSDGLRSLIRYSLDPIGKLSRESEEMLLMIAAHESLLGKELIQRGGGPARGIYGMECGYGRTESDVWQNYLRYRSHLTSRVLELSGVSRPDPEAMRHNPIYSTMMCRFKLLMCPGKLPSDRVEMSEYCSKYYNAGGAGTPVKYYNDYMRLVIRPND